MPRYVVASDFHQNAKALKYMFDRYPDDQIVLLGDFFDCIKNDDALTMAKTLVDCVTQAKTPPMLVVGNHDAFLYDTVMYHDPVALSDWLANGGVKTLREFGYRGAKSVTAISLFFKDNFADLLHVLSMGRYLINDPNIVFVHGGLNWSIPDPLQSLPQEMMWLRESYLFDRLSGIGPHRNLLDKTIVSGHTPIQNFDRHKMSIWKLHHPDDIPNVNRYLIDGGSGSGADNAHVNIVIFDEKGTLISEEAFTGI